MIEKLPLYYRKSAVVSDLYNAIQRTLDNVNGNILDEGLRLFITETDDFALHNKDVGLSEISADDETKRARVIARIRGSNILTKRELAELIGIYEFNLKHFC